MDSKGTSEEITYPNIYFMVDNFEEVSITIPPDDPKIANRELMY